MPKDAPKTLYTHVKHPHTPRNVNEAHAAEQTGFNQRFAVFLTRYVGTMQTAYGFTALAIVGLLGVLAILSPSVYTLIAWLSQTFIQLVLLPVIMVGQNVLSRHSELQADEMFATSQHSFADIEQIAAHLTAQDAKILEIEAINQRQLALLIALQRGAPASAVSPTEPPILPPQGYPQQRDARGRFLPRTTS